MKKKAEPSAHLSALEQQFTRQTRRFSPFEELGLTDKQVIEPSKPAVVVDPSPPKPVESHPISPIVSDASVVSNSLLRVSEQVYEIPLAQLVPSPDQPRQMMDADADQELLESIRLQGVLTPIHVRRVGEQYEVITGERRWRACKLLGRETVPALIRLSSNPQAAAEALIDNLMRKDLTVLDEARAFQSLVERHGYHQNEIADKVGCHKGRISRALSILKLPPYILDLVFSPGSEMTSRHAEALLPLLSEPVRLERITRLAVKQRWTSEQIRTEVLRKHRFNQGSECIRVTLRGEKGSKGVTAIIRWSPNQLDKVESVREGIARVIEVLDTFGRPGAEVEG